MQYFLEAVAFGRMPELEFDVETGDPIWSEDCPQFDLEDTSAEVTIISLNSLQPVKMRFSKVDSVVFHATSQPLIIEVSFMTY